MHSFYVLISSRITFFVLGSMSLGYRVGAESREVSSNEEANKGLGGLKDSSPFPYIGNQIVQSESEN